MENLISIIIPVYNVASYLPECLDSIISQSYQNLEIILVNDGSTDQSGCICNQYAAKDSRIIVIHQNNGGAASAKNAALRIASGVYLAFADADDFVEPGAYEYLVSMLEHNNADVVQGNFRNVFIDRTENHIPMLSFKKFQTTDYLKEYTVDWTCALLWDKLYRRSLFDDIYFEEGHVVDDEYFTYQGIMNAKSIIRVPRVVYNYRKRKSSVTSITSYQSRIIFDKIDYLGKRRLAIISRFPVLKQYFDLHYLNMLLLLIKDPYSTKESINRIKQMLKEFQKETNKTDISLEMMIRIKLAQYCTVNYLLNHKNTVNLANAKQVYYFD